MFFAYLLAIWWTRNERAAPSSGRRVALILTLDTVLRSISVCSNEISNYRCKMKLNGSIELPNSTSSNRFLTKRRISIAQTTLAKINRTRNAFQIRINRKNDTRTLNIMNACLTAAWNSMQNENGKHGESDQKKFALHSVSRYISVGGSSFSKHSDVCFLFQSIFNSARCVCEWVRVCWRNIKIG